MGTREEYMAMRRAAAQANQDAQSGGCGSPVRVAVAELLASASSSELHFMRLHKGSIQKEIVCLAYAVLGEKRPDVSSSEEGV